MSIKISINNWIRYSVKLLTQTDLMHITTDLIIIGVIIIIIIITIICDIFSKTFIYMLLQHLKILLTRPYTCILHSQLVASTQLKYSSKIISTLYYTTVDIPFCLISYLMYVHLAQKQLWVISYNRLCFLSYEGFFILKKRHLDILNPTLRMFVKIEFQNLFLFRQQAKCLLSHSFIRMISSDLWCFWRAGILAPRTQRLGGKNE